MAIFPQKKLAAVVVLVFLDGCNWNDSSRVAESKNRANRIIIAVENYAETHGDYPRSLSDLVPGFLTSVDAPVFGKGEWEYRVVDNGEHFELSFEGTSPWTPVYFWHSRDAKWYEDTR